MRTLLLLVIAAGCTSTDGAVKPADDSAAVDDGCPDVAAPSLAPDAWAQAGDIPATGLHGLSTDGGYPVWVASHSTGLWRERASEAAWDRVNTGVTHILSEVALRPDDPDHAFWSTGGTATRTRDGGQTIDRLPLGTVVPGERTDVVWALAVTAWSPDRVFALSRSGAFSLSADDGDTWTTQGVVPIHNPPETSDHFHVWGWRILPEAAEGGRIVVGDGFGIAVSDDAGATFLRTLDTPLAGHSLVRDPTDATHIVVGSPDGLYESHDEGSTWTLRDIGGDVLAGAWSADGSALLFVGSDTLFLSADGGATFTLTPHSLPTATAVAVLDDGAWLVADQAGAWRSDDDGASWSDIGSGLADEEITVVATDPSCPARVFAGSRCGGGLFRSEDYGASWEAVDTFFHYVMGVYFDPSVRGRIWAVSDDRLLLSEDGETWNQAWASYHYHGFATHPEEPDTLLLGSVGEGEYADDQMRVYRSTDAGASWDDSSVGLPVATSSAHAILRWPGAPDVVVLGTYKGGGVSHQDGAGVGLFRSTDGGETWAAVDIPVIDVAALHMSGDTLYAATDTGIWASSDEGLTWEQRADAQVPIIAIGFGGVYGFALSGAGQLYRSEDSGVTWAIEPTDREIPPAATLAQIAFSADNTVAFLAVNSGVWQIGV